MEKIVLVGAGGHCKVIIDLIQSTGQYEIIGITDASETTSSLLDIPILGKDELLDELFHAGVKNAFVCVGALQNMSLRQKIFNKLKKIGFTLPILVHREAIVSSHTILQEGTCVMAGAIINAGAYIGENCIINTGAVVEHDCILNSNVHVSPKACLAGGVKVGMNTHIGVAATVIQGLHIGENSIIGAGAVVHRDVMDHVVTVGIPAKIIKSR